MMDHRALGRALAYDPELTLGDLRVALALFDCLDYENRLPVCQAELARKLRISRQLVNRHIGSLREAGVILDDGKGPGGVCR